MSRWFRHYAGMMRDDKLVRVAIRSKQTIERVVWVWGAILESAAEIDDDGKYDLDAPEIAYFLRADLSDVEAVLGALEASGRISGSRVVKWGNRQFSSDTSAERQRRYRDKKRAEEREVDQPSGDAEVTSPSRHRDAPETETELETEREVSSKDDRPSDEGPSLQPEHIQEYWNEFAPTLTRPTIRDLTPERRQLVRARIAQYSLEDFQTVFAKCRDSPFLRGDKGRTPLTFDWLMKKGNFQKTLEGNYDR